jgi:T5orf172 domain
VPAPGLFNLWPMAETPLPEANVPSASKEAIKEVFPQEQKYVDQESLPKTTEMKHLFQRAIQQTDRIRSRDAIDKKLIKEIQWPCLLEGHVHIFYSTQRKLCKIGRATDINTRELQIQAGCQLQHFDQVNVTAIRTNFPDRVIKLARIVLQNFLAKLSCEGHHHPEYDNEAVRSEHGEWFDVTKEVALQSVLLWRDFTCSAYTSAGTIKDEWVRRLASLPKPSSTETFLPETVLFGGNAATISQSHLERINLYTKWIREGIA